MPTTIKLKNSVTTTNTPTSLAQGEVAINITDKKVWVGNAATTPIQLLGAGSSASFGALTCTSLTNSGLTSGRVTYATTAGLLTDSANLTFNGTTLTAAALTSTGVATFSAGTVSAPAITTTGDTNTGIFFPAADTIAFTEGGVESMRIDSSGNVGIGTSSPTTRLNVVNTSYSGSSAPYGIVSSVIGGTTLDNNWGHFVVSQASTTNGDGGKIIFGYGSTPGSDLNPIAAITASKQGDFFGNLLFFTRPSGGSNTERMRIDSSGNVGIGTNSPTQRLTVAGSTSLGTASSSGNTSIFQAPGSLYLTLNTNGTLSGARRNWAISPEYDVAGGLSFTVGASEGAAPTATRMLITSGGSLLIGSTSNNANLYVEKSDDGNTFGARNTFATYSATVGFFGANRNTTNNSFYYIDCYNYGSSTYRFRVADSGNVTNTNGSYGTISDAKLKENIVDATPKLDKVNQLKVRNFNLIGDDLKQIGFIAQEFEQVFPSMVEESADKDADGNDLGTTTKTIKTTVLIPILVKAIQEQQAMIEELTNRIKKLEGV